ncbi:patatin-like phospholipase family protein [Shewanella schlegeliana]|uniref:Patatin-like phospholipase family protein n=1 Tax=Shewanella schlegeliana TaxID=190308 RepID=A0ABS1T3T6_9GAMM|nr:patatin-like phospholipase family protein [Shewanella schlegeliana]MBL4914809.1 patatin-like phospholipase family protein [Shewanella schlegeliana]MCL1110500.1 patatin-like phospholipase family protein [Shewanella schlegeliana]GIU27387.1 patatin [Shewanella schlegeliana]
MIKRIIVLCLALASSQFSFAEERPKIGLVLSGGGAKGAAHIGVLKVLEEKKIPIDYIVGTSIGAYVGGMYALGYSAAEIEAIMMNTDWSKGYSDTIPRESLSYRDKQTRDQFNIPINVGYSDDEVKTPAGLLRGQTMSLLLRSSTNLVHQFGDFDDLAIPYRAVATNLVTSEPVVLSSGSVVAAMQASASVPGALQPAVIDGKLLVDGGIANNMPVDVVKAMGADIVIAVDIGSPLVGKDELNSTVAVLNQLSTILTNASSERQKALLSDHDILIRPNIGELSTTDFTIMQIALPLGEIAAREQTDKLEQYSDDGNDYKQYLAHKKDKSRQWLADIDRPLLKIIYDNDSKVSNKLLAENLDLDVGEAVTVEELEAGLKKIYALDKFERVDAEFTDTEEGRVLTVTTKAKSWGPNYFQLGFSWEDDFSLDSAVSLDVAYTMTELTETGGEWRNELSLGYDKLLASEFYQPLARDQHYFSRARVEYELKDWSFFENNSRVFELRQTAYRTELGIGANYTQNGMVEIGILGEMGDLENDVWGLGKVDYTGYGGYFKFAYDDLNSINFPTSGNRFTFNVYLRKEGYELDGVGDSNDFSMQYEADWRGAVGVGNHAFVGIASLATVDKDGAFTVNVSELGGFLNLSGYHKNALYGSHKIFGAFVYQYDLGRDVLGMTEYPLYLGTSIEAGNVWNQKDSVSLDDLIYAGSLYLGIDTSVGPAAFGFGASDDGEKTIFLFLGKNW